MTHSDKHDEIAALGLRWVTAGYRALGWDAALASDVALAGLPLQSLDGDQSMLVPRRAYAALVRAALERLPSFAAEAGTRCPFGTFPLLDCTLAALPSPAHAAQALVRYFGVVSDRGRWSYSSGKLALQAQPHVPPWLWNASAEFGVVYTALRFSELVARPIVLTIEVPWCAPPWAGLYPYPTVFGAPGVSLTLDPAAMLAPSRRADALVAPLLGHAAEQALAAMPAGPPLMRQVQAAIMELVALGLPGMVDVARRLGMTERTLRRRLQDEGLSFRQLREQTLLALASEQLASSDLTITEIAFATGFSELSAFHRAFVRWTGLTPTAWRDDARSTQQPTTLLTGRS